MTNSSPTEEWSATSFVADNHHIDNTYKLARSYSKSADIDTILTLWAYMPQEIMIAEYDRLVAAFGIDDIKGCGVEIGSGLGSFSSYLAHRFNRIKKMYVVELVPDAVHYLQPLVFEAIAKNRSSVLTGVIGDFNELNLDDDSMDFAVAFDALHLSPDLNRSVRELARVVKPEGKLLVIDRAHHEVMSEEQRRLMMDVPFPSSWKKLYNYSDNPLTRGEHGEREYRVSEWKLAFEKAGFTLERWAEVRPNSIGWLLRKLVLLLPFWIRRRLGILRSRVSPPWQEIMWTITNLLTGRNSGVYSRAHHEHSLFLLRKL